MVPVKENKHLNVILSPASEDLEEVTVVAFGQQKRECRVGNYDSTSDGPEVVKQ